MDSMVGLVLLILAFAVACLVVCVKAFEKGERGRGRGYFYAILGALLLFVGSLVAYSNGYGRAARLSNLRENTVYCVAAKVDDTYTVRNVGENKNYLVYSPTQPLPIPGVCFVEDNDFKLVAVTPATTFDGKVVGIPIAPPTPK